MTKDIPKPAPRIKAAGSGAAAGGRGVAAGERGIAAGGNVTIVRNYRVTQVRSYMTDKGPLAYKGMGDPARAWKLALEGEVEISDLREMLLEDPVRSKELKRQPRTVSVKGLLYPCALLVSGWWESRMRKSEGIEWRDGIQEWLFSGFHSWGPSWDFTWDIEQKEGSADKPAFVAQLGDGDEANSIPVIIPADKAHKLVEKFQERGKAIGNGIDVGGVMATVTGVLCHRSHCPEAQRLGLVGGILDFCIWLKPGEAKHKICADRGKPDVYSGYLWKCLAPADLVKQGKALELNDVYFLWEHTNLADENSIKYNLDSLEHKESYIRNRPGNGELVLLQKSSMLVPGTSAWSKQEFYDFFRQKDEDI